MTKDIVALAEQLNSILPENLRESVEVKHGELIVSVTPKNLRQVVRILKEDPVLEFTQLADVAGVDYPARIPRFEVVYQLLSIMLTLRIRVKVLVDKDASIPSISDIFSSANWFEREVWDMYGVRFSGHPDLRRILTDYGFQGHPLRKDFPLTGYVEVRYDSDKKRVVYEPVVLDQEFRNFDFVSPWEGTEYKLPGDEKAKA